MRTLRPSRGAAPSESTEVRGAVLRHLLFAAIALVVVSVPTFYAFERIAEDHALDNAAEDGASISRRLLSPAVTDALITSEPAAISAMDERLVPRMTDGSLARVKIWTPDGRIVYSDVHELIGQTFDANADLRRLTSDGRPVSDISDLEDSENIMERGDGSLVEVYLLGPSAAGRDVVYELYFPLVRVERERDQLISKVAPIGLLALGVLGLSQLPLAVELARRVTTIRRSRERLLAQTVRAVDRARQRLAQDLHDDVIQDLAGVAMALESVHRAGAGTRTSAGDGGDDGASVGAVGEGVVAPGAPSSAPSTAQTIDRTAGIVRRDIQLLRDIVANLFPVTPHGTDLDAAIRELARGLEDRGIEVDLAIATEERLDPVSAGLLFRVAREALNNVVKHAAATRVEVSLDLTRNDVELKVADNGRGTPDGPNARVAGHVGLDIVRETIEEAGGSVRIERRLPRGTVVRAHLPR